MSKSPSVFFFYLMQDLYNNVSTQCTYLHESFTYLTYRRDVCVRVCVASKQVEEGGEGEGVIECWTRPFFGVKVSAPIEWMDVPFSLSIALTGGFCVFLFFCERANTQSLVPLPIHVSRSASGAEKPERGGGCRLR